ncbi:unnamed protein product [Periconia digitata]|uniref:F-box domain-containing protein n=1 Tax=Periconia digitata TaxID=1303443 RepID=A0A9W4UU38_9PLEO|nr:unnamed protein product [Periconia digitata]
MARTPNRRDIARSLLAAEDFPPLPSQISQHATPNNSSDITSAPKRGHESVTSIMSLPDEILLEILEHLHPGRFSTCLRLSRVNRRFYFLVRNELYLRYDSCSKQGYQFMRTIMISPEIGDLVRYVHFSCPGQDIRHLLGRKHPPTTRKYYQPTPSDCRIIKNVLKQLDIPRWKDWATQCNHAIYDTKQEPIYATILMHVRNIAKLIIDQDDFADKNPRWIELIRGSVNGESFKNVNHFTHLHYVRVRVRHLGMPKLAPLFKLPALRYLKIIDVVHNMHAPRAHFGQMRTRIRHD